MSLFEFSLAAAAVFVGAAIWGSLGFGFAFVVIPVISVLDPSLLPPVVWLLGMPFAFAMLRRERQHLEVKTARTLLIGKLVGTPLGVWLLAAVPADNLGIMFAVALLAAVAISAIDRRTVPHRTGVLFSIGGVSGVMGTAAALGGPPLALGLRSMMPSGFRATLAMCFVLGDLMSLLGIVVAGIFRLEHLAMAAAFAPPMMIGFLLSGRVINFTRPNVLRVAVLIFAALSSIRALVIAF